MLHITTRYGNHYTVDKFGYISQVDRQKSGEWVFIGLMPVNCSNLIHLIPFMEITKEWIKSHPLRYKNHHPRYTVADKDHGTFRLWGNVNFHGVGNMWFED